MIIMKRNSGAVFIVLLFLLFIFAVASYAHASPGNETRPGESSGRIANDDLSKAVEVKGKDTLKEEVSKIGGRMVNAVRALFITFFVIAVIFMGLQAAGGGLRDPRKIELIKGGGISATISVVLVYKADTIVSFILNLVGVSVSDILK